MTQVPKFKKFILIACSAAVAALPLFGEQPVRRHSSGTPYDVTISGTILDAATQKPIASAEVSVESLKVKGTTNAQGKYTLVAHVGGLPARVTAARTGYSPVTKSVTATSLTVPATVDFALQSTPTTTIKDTSGNTFVVDTESFKFAYLVPFSGYVPSESANFCLADGTAAHPQRSEISKIIGPATTQTNAKCCNGPVLSVQVTYKTGETSPAFLNDSCFGSEVDVLARDHGTGQFVYFNLINVAEVDLP